MLIFKYVLKTFRLSLLIFFSSYILGVCWLVLCELQESVIDKVLYVDFTDKPEGENPYTERFLVMFGQNYDADTNATPMNRLITVTYFAFTSLSTVGFGDYHPRSDIERFCCAFILLFGVAVFSIIMGSFIEILEEF